MKKAREKIRGIICLLFCIGLCGCVSSNTLPDHQKAAHILMMGGSKHTVKNMFGEPDSKQVADDKSELWVYKHRENDRTFNFIFTPQGKVAQFRPDLGENETKREQGGLDKKR